MAIPYWTRGDLNAFFGLGINMLVNVLVLAGLCVGVVHMSDHDVYRVVLPALGFELLIGNLFYFMLARRLAFKEGRDDVTAMPYGPSVPHMFIVSLVIMLPTYLQTKSPVKAWEAGMAWAFIIGVIILIGAFVGPLIRKFTPRAALLGTLAGISLTFISMRPAAQMWGALWIALPVFMVIVVGFIAGIRLPGNFPVGLAALLLGTAIGWIGGFMDAGAVSDSVKEIAVGIPSLNLDLLGHGLNGISPLLATAIPLGIYNFTEAMSNVESAAAAGDSYNLRAVLLADGTGAVVGACLGSPFPPAVYIGHPGWKAAGGRIGYSLATGVLIFVLCVVGLFPLLGALLPIPAIVPVLLYIGLVIGAQAFRAVPKAHYAAIVLAAVPNLAQWASGLIDNALSAAGTSAGKVGETALENAGVVYGGLTTLGEGAVLAGMVLGAIAVMVIDRRFIAAAGFCLFAAALTIVGLIHGPKVHLFESPKVALGYVFAALVCVAFAQMKLPPREADPLDPVDVEEQALRAAATTAVAPEPRVAVPA
jgi:AGZA family xanthine/uracil permease-like MFS transporter